MSFPPESERPDLSIHAVKFSYRNIFRALVQTPFGGPLPKTGTYRRESIVTSSDGGLELVDRVSSDVKPGDHVIVFTQGTRPE